MTWTAGRRAQTSRARSTAAVTSTAATCAPRLGRDRGVPTAAAPGIEHESPSRSDAPNPVLARNTARSSAGRCTS